MMIGGMLGRVMVTHVLEGWVNMVAMLMIYQEANEDLDEEEEEKDDEEAMAETETENYGGGEGEEEIVYSQQKPKSSCRFRSNWRSEEKKRSGLTGLRGIYLPFLGGAVKIGMSSSLIQSKRHSTLQTQTIQAAPKVFTGFQRSKYVVL
jgi:hypothetical protein